MDAEKIREQINEYMLKRARTKETPENLLTRAMYDVQIEDLKKQLEQLQERKVA